MFYSWYLPNRPTWTWVCGVLLIVAIPVSVGHDRNWRRTLLAYAEKRREAGAEAGEWPPADLAFLMGLQLWLVALVTGMLAVMTAVAVWAALLWPQRPPGFESPLNPYDLPYVWGVVAAGAAGVVAGVTLAIALARSKWSPVADRIRRAVYAEPGKRDRLFREALALDPGIDVGIRADRAASAALAGRAHVLNQLPVADLEDAVGPLGDGPVVGDDEERGSRA